MKIGIIIPTCNIKNFLTNCVTSIKKYTNPNIYKLFIEENNFEGFAKVVNKGIRKALKYKDIDYIFLLNDDTIVKEGWIESYTCKIKEYDIIGPNGTFRGDFVPFWAVLIKRKVIENIGLLDERFIGGECEDIDFCIRATEAGFSINQAEIVLPIQPIEHLGTKTFGEGNIKFQKERKKNKQRFNAKWKNTKWENKFD